jgi:hypothetical protein
MLNDKHLLILTFVVIGLILLVRIFAWRFKNVDRSTHALDGILERLIVFGLIVIGLLMAMPSSFDFRMIEYPQQFKSLDEVHAYLNNQSKMLERLSMMIQTFLYLFVIFFLSDLYRMAKSLAARRATDPEAAEPDRKLHRLT